MQPKPQGQPIDSICAGIEDGRIKIPQFQRNFVWSMEKSAKVVDSVLKGYPIGTFIFWETLQRLRHIRSIGGKQFREIGENRPLDYVLDGQQRLTSLYACFKGIEITRESGKVDDFSKIYIDLSASPEEQIVYTDISQRDQSLCVSVKSVYELGGDFSHLEDYRDKIRTYQRQMLGYQYSIIQLPDAPLDVATEVFTRINTAGRVLSLFEIMVAKTFDADSDFDLSEKYEEVQNSLREIDYDTIPDITVLQALSLILKRECNKKVILSLDKKEFINCWPKAREAVEAAAEYFRNAYRIPVSKLLPYNALLASFAYFFFKNNQSRPNSQQRKMLEDFFWRAALTGRYSFASESKLSQDVRHMDKILAGEEADYGPEWGVDLSADYVQKNGRFSAGRGYIKAILCLYAYQQPKSFNDNSDVRIGNDWLKRANSRNYHHFFPKSFLEKQGEDWEYINHILNITIVDDHLNKREIGAKRPSVYMRKFQRENPDLEKTMKTHLIPDLEKFGVLDDDYDTFFKERAKIVGRELSKRIIRREAIDGTRDLILDDTEEDTEQEEE